MLDGAGGNYVEPRIRMLELGITASTSMNLSYKAGDVFVRVCLLLAASKEADISDLLKMATC